MENENNTVDLSTVKSTLQILKDARQEIIDKIWVQGSTATQKGNVCIAMAVGNVCYLGEADLSNNVGAVGNFLRQAIGLPVDPIRVSFSDLIAWNDVEGRTKDEVIMVFDKAMQLAELEESKIG